MVVAHQPALIGNSAASEERELIWNDTGNGWKRAFSLRALHVTSLFAIALQLSCSIESDGPMADRETPVPVVPEP